MALKTKSSIANVGEALGLKASEFTFLNPPKIAVPNGTVYDLSGNVRQIADPSKTLKPAMGIERISLRSLEVSVDEKGPNGERVWKLDNGDDRVRFIGNWTQVSGTSGPLILNTASGTTDYFEVTFYGTGLNLLTRGDSAVTNASISIDGGSESSLNIPAQSTILIARNYSPNNIFNLVSGLTLGIHTVKYRSTTNALFVQGFEILNESSTIKVPQGELFAAGRKYSNNALQSIAYNSGFDGNPVLNGRGGRVVEYITAEGEIGKVIQQTDNAQANLASADHTNEEVIRRINFREFGANRADDFSTLTTSSNRAFTLDDGTTTLVGSGFEVSASGGLQANVLTNYITLTFVGTGLDIVRDDSGNASPSVTYSATIDGTNVGNLNTVSSTATRIEKIVSGLPYGTHTVRLTATVAGTFLARFYDFIIYGPKKPSIPEGAQEINEYYLMANFVANTVAGNNTISTGTLRKSAFREFIYENTWSIDNTGLEFDLGGGEFFTTVLNAKVSYTFFGTGFDLRFLVASNSSNNALVTLNGINLTAANFPSASFSTYGTGTGYNTGTAILDQVDAATQFGGGFVVSGLPLAKYTLTINNGTAAQNLRLNCLDIITPIHYPNTKAGSLSMGPSVQLQRETSLSGVDLSKAKAWVLFDAINNKVEASYNISAVLSSTAARKHIFLETPFKSNKYIVCSGVNLFGGATAVDGIRVDIQRTNMVEVVTYNAAGTEITGSFYLAFFGELEDEE